MPGGSKQCQPIWDEFINNRDALLFESEMILAKSQGRDLDAKYACQDDTEQEMLGLDKEINLKTRVNQYIFRKIVLTNYTYKCAISGVDIPSLLVASHIIPWSQNKKERLNPANGICLSSLYDKAFDSGLISFSDDLKVMCSPKIKENAEKDYYITFFKPIESRKIALPEKYLPGPGFLEWHRENIFLK